MYQARGEMDGYWRRILSSILLVKKLHLQWEVSKYCSLFVGHLYDDNRSLITQSWLLSACLCHSVSILSTKSTGVIFHIQKQKCTPFTPSVLAKQRYTRLLQIKEWSPNECDWASILKRCRSNVHVLNMFIDIQTSKELIQMIYSSQMAYVTYVREPDLQNTKLRDRD